MIPAGIPDRRMVAAGRDGVFVIKHGIQGHLIGDADAADIPFILAEGRGQSAAGAFPANHELIAADAERRGVRFQVKEQKLTVISLEQAAED